MFQCNRQISDIFLPKARAFFLNNTRIVQNNRYVYGLDDIYNKGMNLLEYDIDGSWLGIQILLYLHVLKGNFHN